MPEAGTLYIVATPIGNLEDITLRAQRILCDVSLILAEDTRVSRRLIDSIGSKAPLETFHDFNKERQTPRILALLTQGQRIALISDAGTPGIADEAFYLVRAALSQNIPVVPLPGPCACITALVASGLPTDRFIFENFLDVKSGRRKRYLESLATEPRTVIFYESPHRIVKVLTDLNELYPDLLVVIARELTKMYEEFMRGTPTELLARFNKVPPRGEFTVMLNTRIRQAAAKAPDPSAA